MSKRFCLLFIVLVLSISCQSLRVSRTQYASVYFNLANAYRELGKTDEALKSYYQALQIDPKMTRNAFNFSKLLIEKKRYNEALKLLSALHDDSPQNIAVLEVLAYLYYLKGDYRSSAFCYKKILAINPLHENALFNSALLYEALEMKQEAYERLIETLPLLKDSTDALKKIALLAYDLQHYDDALTYMKEYLTKKSNDSSIEWEYARILAKTKNYKEAADIYDKLDTDSNTHAELMFERAEVYLLGLESYEKGKEILERAIAHEFWDTDRLYKLAVAEDFLYRDEITAYLKEENLFFNPEKERLKAVRAVEKRRADAEAKEAAAAEKATAAEQPQGDSEKSATESRDDSVSETAAAENGGFAVTESVDE